MPLMLDSPPSGADRVVDAAITELIGEGAIAFGRGIRPVVAAPIPVYHLGADSIADGRGLAAATPVGWLATVRNGAEVIGGLELAPNERAGGRMPSVRFASFASGPMQRAVAEAVDAAEKRAGRGRTRIALVRAPALYLMALWLNDGKADSLVPIAPAPASLRPGEPIAAERALIALQEQARAVLQGDDRRN